MSKGTLSILLVVMLSGMTSLIYEVIWARPLGIVFGSTIYAWGTILVSFILGMGLGSIFFARFMDKVKNPVSLFAFVEFALGAFGLAMVPLLNSLSPFYLSLFSLFHNNFDVFIVMQGLVLFAILLLPTFFMGATFPIGVRIYSEERKSAAVAKKTANPAKALPISALEGKASGLIYGVATVGSAIGAFLASFILISSIGIMATSLFAGVVNLFLGFYLITTLPRALSRKSGLKLLIPFLLMLIVIPLYTIGPPILGAYYYPNIYFPDLISKTPFSMDGLYGTVSVIEFQSYTKLNESGLVKTLLIDGRSDGGTVLNDLRTQYFLAYLPLTLNPQPKTSLNIGLGTGITSGVLARYTQTTTVEIDPLMVKASAFFAEENGEVLNNENHTLTVWDARNYLLLNDKQYDIIVSEPSRTWAKGSSPLFSVEFLDLAKNRLNENGLFCQWVPIFELDSYSFQVFYHTFESVFPYVMIFGNFVIGEVYAGSVVSHPSEIIFVGFKNRPAGDISVLNSPILGDSRVIEDFARVSNEPQDLQKLLLCDSDALEGFATGVPINTDDFPILEFTSSRNIVVLSDCTPQIIDALTNARAKYPK